MTEWERWRETETKQSTGLLSDGDAHITARQWRGAFTAFLIGQEHLKSLLQSIRPAWPGIIAPFWNDSDTIPWSSPSGNPNRSQYYSYSFGRNLRYHAGKDATNWHASGHESPGMCTASGQVKEVKPNIRLRTLNLFEPWILDTMCMEKN